MSLMEADFADAILEIVRAAENLNFYTHEIDRQIPAVHLREADRVFLRGDDGFSLAFFAAVNRIEHLLLSEPVMVGEAFGIDQFSAKFHQALLETLGLCDAAER